MRYLMKFLPFCLLLLLLAGIPGPGPARAATAAAGREKIDRVVAETVTLRRDSADRRQAWLEQKAALESETHDLELEARLLEARVRKLESYRSQRQAEIARLETGLREMAAIGLQLEPWLDELSEEIAGFVKSDLPFDREERARRLADLRRELNRYDVQLAEKLRRVFEVLKIEAGYGRGFEVSEESLPLAGTDTVVQVLRLGRVGIYYMTLDGKRAGWFNRRTGQWEPLARSYHEALREALRMALKQRAFELVRLPVEGEEK
jgi:hypothetical protein